MRNYYYNVNNTNSNIGIGESLYNLIKSEYKPIIVCIGTDAVIGDSLGPLIGSMLSEKLKGELYVYGTLEQPITAIEVESLANYLNLAHPHNPILAIDAGVGGDHEEGLIKISEDKIRPGLGVNKNLTSIGNFSIVSIVGKKGIDNYFVLKNTRLRLIYEMATIIVDGILQFLELNGEIQLLNPENL